LIDCQSQCKTNPIPIDLVGNWRGLQINKGYIVGEWKAVFTEKNVTISKPSGEKFTAAVSTVGMYISLNPINGPIRGKIQTLWQLSFGPVTKILSWAWGVPGGKPPTSFDSAMTESQNSHYEFVSCLSKDTSVCNFDH